MRSTPTMGDPFRFAHIFRRPADEPPMQPQVPTSRAVIRYIEAGSSVSCAHCRGGVLFRARVRAQQVICNVYDEGRWLRVEHYHRDCYDEAGAPYGTADDTQPMRPRQRAAAAAVTAA